MKKELVKVEHAVVDLTYMRQDMEIEEQMQGSVLD